MRLSPARIVLAVTLLCPLLTCSAASDYRMTVITEVDDAAKELPVVYTSLSGALHSPTSSASVQRLSTAQLDPVVQGALAAHGFKPATSTSQPALVIEYRWGDWTANGLPDLAMGRGERRLAIQRIRTRAAIAAGREFANQYQAVLLESMVDSELNREGPGGPAAAARAQMSSLADPAARFARQSSKHAFLCDQATHDCYYVIVSAYAYDPDTASKRDLVWRTSMTVSTAGLSPRDAIPMLIEGATPWYGVRMTQAEIFNRPKPARKK